MNEFVVSMFMAAAVGIALVVLAVVVAVVGLGVYRDIMKRTYNERWFTQAVLLGRVMGIASIGLAITGIFGATLIGALPERLQSRAGMAVFAAFATAIMFYVFAFASSFLEHGVSRSPFESRRMVETMRQNGLIVGSVFVLLSVAAIVYVSRITNGVPTAEEWVASIAAKGAMSAFVYSIAIALRHADPVTGPGKQKEPFWIETKMWLAVALGVFVGWVLVTAWSSSRPV